MALPNLMKVPENIHKDVENSIDKVEDEKLIGFHIGLIQDAMDVKTNSLNPCQVEMIF